MPIELFLNDLSMIDDNCGGYIAADRLIGFAKALKAAHGLDGGFRINAHKPLAQLSFANGWPLAALRNQARCADERTYLKTVVSRSPWTSALAERASDAAGGADYALRPGAQVAITDPPIALGLAHDLDGLAISLPTGPFWRQRMVPLDRITLDEDANEVRTGIVSRNACTAEDVAHHGESIAPKVAPTVADGLELWASRAQLFPYLRFIARVKDQIEGLQNGSPTLPQVLSRLLELNAAIEEWTRTGAPHPVMPFNRRAESSPKRRKLATFRVDGIDLFFSEHCDFGPIEGRIHYIVESQPVRHALIGHVDRKLGIG